jgi:copper(I)-binding protein
MFGLARLRIIEIGVALLLTLAAILFVGLTVWAAEMAQIDVADAWARPTVGSSRISTAYMTIANKGATDDRLKSARTLKATSVELHQTTMTADGVMQMRPVEDGLPVEAGSSLVLAPGGAHFMLLGLEDALETVPVSATAPEPAGTSE